MKDDDKNSVPTTQMDKDSVFQPNQNTSDFFHRTRINNPKVCMELQETPSSQSYLKKEKQS